MTDATRPPSSPSRQDGLARLSAFALRMGRDYAARRNYDLGQGNHRHVSGLSPWVRHRLVLETELVATAIERHGFAAAEKFIQEVCWRTYWKGWLEMRPTVWHDYLAAVRDARAALDRSRSRSTTLHAATRGETGIDCFDHWARELVDTGYLHNHARMWFASIWIFTLDLPWTLGADFFLRNLLDADPASNTLSWRWVAGLQTRGKTYLAKRSNIRKYTRGRFDPPGVLAPSATPLQEPVAPAPRPLSLAGAPDPDTPALLLLHEDDLNAESLGLDANIVHVAAFPSVVRRSAEPVNDLARDFAHGALADGLDRAGAHYGVTTSLLRTDDGVDVLETAGSAGARQVVVPWAPVGPARDALDGMTSALDDAGVPLARVRRAWDDDLWPHAKKGFFAFKTHIPAVLTRHGLMEPGQPEPPRRRTRYLRRTGGR